MSTPDRSLRAISPVLIANRGEIAGRVARTVAELGLESIGVFTEPDRGSPHLEAVDRAVRIDSYLSVEDVLDAATRVGAGSVHPGYGFLSENPALARAVIEAGLSWVGPPPEAIEAMGDKGRSKRIAAEAGVPVIAGTDDEDPNAETIAAFGAEVGFPIVIKALAGGGGKGMRIVSAPEQVVEALAAARREAATAFGDERVLAERYLQRPRHIEVQVLCDSHGNRVHLGERECSLQRRHQKVIEEAPSPAVEAETRRRMGEAALELCRACGYEGAGTVELIAPAEDGDFFFLEMNTRLQVEHPVTELVWRVDLVEQQLRIAAGQSLAFSQADLSARGHAVEARIYAEDPSAGFLPAIGPIVRYREPTGAGVRVDSGVREGTVVGTDFDPMLAKVIAAGPDRETALGRLERALGELELLGPAHNAGFCRELLRLDAVRAGWLDTGLLERSIDGLELSPPSDLSQAAIAIRYLLDLEGIEVAGAGPWRRSFEQLGSARIVDRTIETDGREPQRFEAAIVAPGEARVELDGITRRYCFFSDPLAGETRVGRGGFQLTLVDRSGRRSEATVAGSLQAPMPGTVLEVRVADGDEVEEGDVLIVLESMKMELQVSAPNAGQVNGLSLSPGDRVEPRQTLLAVVAADSDSGSDSEPEAGGEGQRP